MNSKQLRQCLKEDSLTQYYMGGVMASDTLPRDPPLHPKCVYIINTDPASQPGRHWLAVYLPPGKQPVEFFDVLGHPPTYYGTAITQFVKANGPDYVYQKQRLQSPEAITCGHFCLYYIMYRVRGVPMEEIMQNFSPAHVKVNEQIVLDFVTV